jgi:hypothetical protein
VYEQSLHVLDVLIESLKFFDRELIQMAATRSFKSSKVPVSGFPKRRVPRESVYDTELLRILTNWLEYPYEWMVTGQWHLRTQERRDQYTDITLKNGDETIIMELLATEDPSVIQSHFEKTPEYMALHSADQVWVIHFTCEKDYEPVWQSDAQLAKGLNMVHFSHGREFSEIQIWARWRDDEGVQCDYQGSLTI